MSIIYIYLQAFELYAILHSSFRAPVFLVNRKQGIIFPDIACLPFLHLYPFNCGPCTFLHLYPFNCGQCTFLHLYPFNCSQCTLLKPKSMNHLKTATNKTIEKRHNAIQELIASIYIAFFT